MSQPALVSEAFPAQILAAYIVCVAGAGVFTNCALLTALFKSTKNGLSCILIQLVLSDLLLLCTSLWLELWSLNIRTWMFGRSSCIAYRGLSILASSASLYLITAASLHSLATVNLEERAAQTNKRNDNDDTEIRCSRHSLVANSDSSTPPRTMNVDYRLANTKISIILPTAFVWILSASLSIPEFTLTATLKTDTAIQCTLEDSSHMRYMHSMLSIFNFFLPILILTTVGALIICKLKRKIKLSRIDADDSIAFLRLSLYLIIVYGIFCVPRSVYSVYGLYTSYNNNKIEFIQSNDLSIDFILCATNLFAYLIRPLICIIFLPKLRKVFVIDCKSVSVDNV